jgi:predicted RNase H-like HicB family nuclease
MKTYHFTVIVEADFFEDGREAYHAYVPALQEKGAATWGFTRAEALANLKEVVQLVVESMIEHQEPLPAETRSAHDAPSLVSRELTVSVSV